MKSSTSQVDQAAKRRKSTPAAWAFADERTYLETASQFGLTEKEALLAAKKLERQPNLVELGMISAMWSEHCSYKSSRILLKQLPTQGPNVLQGPGENAGVVDLGDDVALCFKIE